MKPLVLAALIIVLAAILYHFASRDFFAALEAFTASLGTAGPAVAAMVYVGATVLLIPGSALTLTAAALFGFKTAFLVVFVGANLGSLCAFLLARTFLRRRIVRWAATKPQFRSIDRAIERRAFATILLARLSPALPFNALNYFFGITSVDIRAYALATLVGILPGMVAYVYLGAAARDVLAAGLDSLVISYQQLLKVVGLLATVALAIMIARRARKELAQIEGEAGNPMAPGSKDQEA